MKAISASLITLVGISVATGADLSKIDRQLTKEPPYKSKPRYSLLVFGPEAAARVWLVADGDTIYFDRNANGDLTDSSERIELKPFDPKKPEEGLAPPQGFGEVAIPSGVRYKVQGIQNLGRSMAFYFEEQKVELKKGKGPEVEKQLKELEEQVKAMENYYMVAVELPGKIQQYAAMTLGDSVKDAPVFHFDGPLQLWTTPHPQLTRGDKDAEISALIVTPGYSKVKSPFGQEPQVLINCCTEGSVPKDVHPVVEIEFPNKEPGGKPIVAKYELNQRC
jgi:hypothetical protein